MQLIFKTFLAGAKPYSTLSGDEYLALLQKYEKHIYQGSFGVYLARKVVVENQELYQPLIDIDGAAGLEGNQKTDSAIQFAHATIKALNYLGATDYFKFLATGATGFRALSDMLLNRSAYFAFVDWMRFEMPHLHDLKPTVETDNPHQVEDGITFVTFYDIHWHHIDFGKLICLKSMPAIRKNQIFSIAKYLEGWKLRSGLN